MKTDFFDVLESRRSIRMYRATPIDQTELGLLVEMGMKAPTAGNLQDYRFIISTNKNIIYQLPDLCMDQMWITSAPAIIVVCSQPKEQAKWFGERGRHVFATQNAAAATQNILLAAHALGLGACWIGGFDQEQVDKLFGVTGNGRVESIITIGYPAEHAQPKDELGIAMGMYFDTWGNNKGDKVLIHKDYSLKLNTYRQKAKEQAKDTSSKSVVWLKSIKDKIKQRHDKYKESLEKSSKNQK
ncbi:nitroreductase family protein [Candidatus Woesearchaeota archaeon]|nr:nitroreductase family protein [Candidatus Woesearchaeota archaeon]